MEEIFTQSSTTIKKIKNKFSEVGLPFFASPSRLTEVCVSEASSETLFFLLSLEVRRCLSFSGFSTSSSSFVCPFSWPSPGTIWGGITGGKCVNVTVQTADKSTIS